MSDNLGTWDQEKARYQVKRYYGHVQSTSRQRNVLTFIMQ